MPSKTDYTKKAHAKMRAAGWTKKGIWFSPMATMDLEREVTISGLKPGEVIAKLLAEKRPR